MFINKYFHLNMYNSIYKKISNYQLLKNKISKLNIINFQIIIYNNIYIKNINNKINKNN